MITEYINYLQSICDANVAINAPGGHLFQVVGVEEAMGDFKGKIAQGGFFFRVILPSQRYSWNTDHHLANVECGLEIGKMFTKGDTTSQLAAIQSTWDAVTDIVERMIYDSRNAPVYFALGFNTAEATFMEANLVTGDSCYASTRLMWTVDAQIYPCDPAIIKWSDLT